MIKVPLSSTERSRKHRALDGLASDVVSSIECESDDIEELERRGMAAQRYKRLFPMRAMTNTGIDCDNIKTVHGKPGDSDYDGICTPAWIAAHKAG